jgi:hypothetical protein
MTTQPKIAYITKKILFNAPNGPVYNKYLNFFEKQNGAKNNTREEENHPKKTNRKKSRNKKNVNSQKPFYGNKI